MNVHNVRINVEFLNFRITVSRKLSTAQDKRIRLTSTNKKSLARDSIISIDSSGGKSKLELPKIISRRSHRQTKKQKSSPSRVQPKNRQPRLRLAQLNPRLLVNQTAS